MDLCRYKVSFLYRTLLNKVAEILPTQLKIVAPEDTYNVGKHPESAALTVSGGSVTVSVTLTSPLMRETPKPAAAAGDLIVLYFHGGQEKDNCDNFRNFSRKHLLFSCCFLSNYVVYQFCLFFSWPESFSVHFFKHQEDAGAAKDFNGCQCIYALTYENSFPFQYSCDF